MVVHGVFSGKKEGGKQRCTPQEIIERIKKSPVDKFFLTDSVPHDPTIFPEKFIIVSVAKLLARAITYAITGESITSLHNMENVHLYS